MAKKCPPGVICLENATLLGIFVLFSVLMYTFAKQSNESQSFNKVDLPTQNDYQTNIFNNLSVPKAKEQTYINVPTQRTGYNFSQVGILTNNDNDKILPLMGKLLLSGRNTWQYYSMSDQNNSIRLPVSFNGKSCMDEYGCDEILNGDSVYIDGYNDTFSATLYEKPGFTYNPMQSLL